MSKSQADFDSALIEIEKTCRTAYNGKDWDIDKASHALSEMVEVGRLTEGEGAKILNYIQSSNVIREEKVKQEKVIEDKMWSFILIIYLIVGGAVMILPALITGRAFDFDRLVRTTYAALPLALIGGVWAVVCFNKKKGK